MFGFAGFCLVPEGMVPDGPGTKAMLPVSLHQGFHPPLNPNRGREMHPIHLRTSRQLQQGKGLPVPSANLGRASYPIPSHPIAPHPIPSHPMLQMKSPIYQELHGENCILFSSPEASLDPLGIRKEVLCRQHCSCLLNQCHRKWGSILCSWT